LQKQPKRVCKFTENIIKRTRVGLSVAYSSNFHNNIVITFTRIYNAPHHKIIVQNVLKLSTKKIFFYIFKSLSSRGRPTFSENSSILILVCIKERFCRMSINTDVRESWLNKNEKNRNAKNITASSCG